MKARRTMRSISIAVLLAMLLGLFPLQALAADPAADAAAMETDAASGPFTDVSSSQYYYNPVQWAYTQGIVTGITSTTFGPDRSCTRGQAVTFLYRYAGEPAVTVQNTFSDVPGTEYYYRPVLWGSSKGIVKGTGADTFSPSATVTRAQFITFLWRLAGEPKATGSNPFTDVTIKDYYFNAVVWGYNKGIVSGTSDTAFSPNASCTRGQVVTFLYRYYNASTCYSAYREVVAARENSYGRIWVQRDLIPDTAPGEWDGVFGVCDLRLIDLDADGVQELIMAWSFDGGEYPLNCRVEIWDYDGSKAVCIYNGDVQMAAADFVCVYLSWDGNGSWNLGGVSPDAIRTGNVTTAAGETFDYVKWFYVRNAETGQDPGYLYDNINAVHRALGLSLVGKAY